MVCAPSALAICTPTCPSPPKPRMATRWPGPAPQRRSGEYTVMPAHISGAAFCSGMACGIRTAKASSTTIFSL